MWITKLFKLSQHGVVYRMLFLVAVTWLPLLVLSFFEGNLYANRDVPFLKDVIPYVRCLLVIPLLVAIEALIAPMLANVADYLSTSRLLTDEDIPKYEKHRDTMYRRMNSVSVGIFLLLLAVLLSWLMKADYRDMLEVNKLSSWAIHSHDGKIESSLAGVWFIYISLPVVSFVLYRWVWRFVAWCIFLYRVSRLNLQLQATHSDLCGGLGIIGNANIFFGVLFIAMSMTSSAALANNLLYEGDQATEVKIFIVVYLIISIIVINVPLFAFSGKLFKLKREAFLQYSLLQGQSSEEFHQHWIREKNKKMVDSVHPSALADYSAVYEIVSGMRIVPINPRGIVVMSALILVPFLPLVFTQSSFQEVMISIGSSIL